MSSFIAAGTAYATHAISTIPFFLFYSMFGFQRIGDLVWAAADMRCRGFLVGATAGRTTLAGEGLQHQDGHSHHLAQVVPTVRAYDPAYAYEIAVIVRDGLRRMYVDADDAFYYLTVGNEAYAMPPMPAQSEEGILRGMYLCSASQVGGGAAVQLLGSGAILNETLRAQALLAERFSVAADVWSVTSYQELRRDALEVERWNRLHPTEPERVPYVSRCLAGRGPLVVAASDYLKSLPDAVARWMPARLVSLGTDGFGRSDTREALRDFFEVDARHIAVAALHGLAMDGRFEAERVRHAIAELGIDSERANPALR